MRPLTALGLGASLLALAVSAASSGTSDALANKVTLTLPRCSLAQALATLSRATKVQLVAEPPLANQQLVGYVPDRPLRETMDALAELFEATWKPMLSSANGFRLAPLQDDQNPTLATRRAHLSKLRATLDGDAAATVKALRNHTESDLLRDRNRDFAKLLWFALSKDKRDSVLRGTRTTIPIAKELQSLVYETMLIQTDQDRAPLKGPILASFDLDEGYGVMLPHLRARATALRKNSIIGTFGAIDLARVVHLPRAKQTSLDASSDRKLGPNVGDGGQFYGSTDLLTLRVAEGCGIPILSRQRAASDGIFNIAGAGRTVQAVLSDLATRSDVSSSKTSTGFVLFRSYSEALDSASIPSPRAVESFLWSQSAMGERISFQALARLAALSPLQLKVLQRSNTCSGAAGFAYDLYGLLRFFNKLSQIQQERLFDIYSPQVSPGVEVRGLPHSALHALLEPRAMRGNFDIYSQLQDTGGLTLLFRERPTEPFAAKGLRGGEEKTKVTRELPIVEDEARPIAK